MPVMGHTSQGVQCPALGRDSHFACPSIPTVAAVAILLTLLSACNFTPQGREAKHMASGKNYLAAKDYKRAVIEFKVASQNMPKDPEPLYQLGMTYLEQAPLNWRWMRFRRARRRIRNMRGRSISTLCSRWGASTRSKFLPQNKFSASTPPRIQTTGSRSAPSRSPKRNSGNKDESLKLIDTAVKRDPGHLRPAAAVIALYTAKGDLDTAKQIARDISTELPDSPAAAVLRAQVSLAAHDYDDADAQISRALALKPGFPLALELRLHRDLMERDRQGAEQTTENLAQLAGETYGHVLCADVVCRAQIR